MINATPTMCMACVHLNKRTVNVEPGKNPSCSAYPDGIPQLLWTGGAPHINPTGDDNDFQFEMRPGGERHLAAYFEFWYQPDDLGDPDSTGRGQSTVDP